ncbi:MAG: 50S ribosomal protein L3 [Clostridia bacterium]|nr:50S ribosomal protein L3 [Clostridia bacterium]MDD4572448.1 50S ribosomal protein L3 [Clostridia bacterium]
MPKLLLGKKLGMTQIFAEDGKIIPVTVIEAGPCLVSQVKTAATDGYEAVQIGYGAAKKPSKPVAGHFAKSGVPALRYLREMRVSDAAEYQPGQEIKADIFAAGEKIDVEGTSKGKGFAGTIKRWNFQRGPMGHGSKNHRRPASAGAKGPARIFKGKKSPGRLGGEKVTVQNLEIVRVDVDRNMILVKGAVPGPKRGLVVVKSAVKAGK